MRFQVVVALLTTRLVTAAPYSPYHNGLVGEAAGNTNIFQPQNSCILVLSGEALHCSGEPDHDTGVAFPSDEQLKPFFEYKDCVLANGVPWCERPHSSKLVEEIIASLDGKDVNALAEEFDKEHSGYELKDVVEVVQAGFAKTHPLKDAVEDASVGFLGMSTEMATLNDGECCRRDCAFTLWWGPIPYGVCLALCTCPG